MAIKSTREIQKYLNSVGFKCGLVDGIQGTKTTAAIKNFQTSRGLVRDGIVGPKTLAELNRKETVNWTKSKYFKRKEFHCQCNGLCNSYPAPISGDLVNLLNKLRIWLGKPIYITSGLRCYRHNANVGGVPGSRHVSGRAVDITWDGINGTQKQKVINKAYELGASYSYTNGTNMAGAVHIDVKGW